MENYFNYFTEIEECFRRCRGTVSLLSPLDWALIESWKEADIPLQAVLAGIERSFKKYARRPKRFQKINGVAYCSQEVLRAAEEAKTLGGAPATQKAKAESPFPQEEVLTFLRRNAGAIEAAARQAQENGEVVLAGDLSASASALGEITARESQAAATDLEDLERRLTALEEKLTAVLARAASVELLAAFRLEIDTGLRVDRRKMSAAQIEALERQFLKKRLFEHHKIPRLSLFYL